MKHATATNPKSRRVELKEELLNSYGIDVSSNLIDELLHEHKQKLQYSKHKLIDELLSDERLMCEFVEFVINETEE